MPDRTPDRVSYSYGRTINTGNYESMRVDASISTDVPIGQPVDEALQNISAMVEQFVDEKTNELPKRQRIPRRDR